MSDQAMPQNMLELSVIIPTHNRRELLLDTIAALGTQTFPARSFEVVVMCDGDQDGSWVALTALKTPFQLRALSQPQAGAATARNNAVAQAAGRVILFLDDDIVALPELLSEHMRLHTDPEHRVVVGRLLPDPTIKLAGWTQWEQRIFDNRYQALENSTLPVDGRKFYSGNVSVTRAAFVAAGGFNTTFKRAEDIELGYRLQKAGAQLLFNGAAAAIHRGVHGFAGWGRTQYNYGRYDVRLAHDEGNANLVPFGAWFRQRNALNQFLGRVAVDRPVLHRLILAIARLVARLSDWLGLRPLSHWSYSAIANLYYWQGVADELGGVSKLWKLVRAQPAK